MTSLCSGKNGAKIISPEFSNLVREVYKECLSCCESLSQVELVSKVPGKRYFAFAARKDISRAVNEDLWSPSLSDWDAFEDALNRKDFSALSDTQINRTLYSVAISFCSWCDLYDDPRKVPGTFFEKYIANLVGRYLGVVPTNSLQVLKFDDDDTELPTDLIFDLGKRKKKYHVPVKTSTRERGIQMWAHQRVIDGVYGTAKILGTPVLLTETKTDTKKREVVEICTPMQWQLFQSHIAKLDAVYYLDVPAKYEKLNSTPIRIAVSPFGAFFQ